MLVGDILDNIFGFVGVGLKMVVKWLELCELLEGVIV